MSYRPSDIPTIPGHLKEVSVTRDITWGETCDIYTQLTAEEARVVAMAAIDTADAVEYSARRVEHPCRMLMIEQQMTSPLHDHAPAFAAITGLAAHILRGRGVDAQPEVMFSWTEEDSPDHPDISHSILIRV